MAQFISNRSVEALSIARDEAVVIIAHNLRVVQLHSIYDDSTKLHEASANVHYYSGIRDFLNLLLADQATPKMQGFMQVLDMHYELKEKS